MGQKPTESALENENCLKKKKLSEEQIFLDRQIKVSDLSSETLLIVSSSAECYTIQFTSISLKNVYYKCVQTCSTQCHF